METNNQHRFNDIHVSLIHTLAIIAVILVHATGRWPLTIQEINQLPPLGTACLAIVFIYQA
ncbi:MAG: hypothetical protein LBQ98_00080 [Nitrososphaerota archaeon]|jgi:hypothetical protein|nr:hypothetical protein [Nitrososphaerota archaeon]